MRITVNGELREVADKATVASLLELLELQSRYLAVEVNRELVSRDRHHSQVLATGDLVEIVTLVGGG